MTDIIESRWSSKDAADLLVIDNPSTGAEIARVRGGGAVEVDGAVRAARAAQQTWSDRAPRERGGYLRRAARLIEQHADDLARLESREMGKPVSQARNVDIAQTIVLFDYYAGLVEVLPSQVRDSGFAVDLTALEPYGVIAGIIPFNWPPLHVGGKAAPALALGNGCVLKPPEQCPMTIMRIVDMVNEILPDDVLHVVPGADRTGIALVEHELVDKVIFTGSPETGRAVLRSLADRLTPALLELGGKNPLVAFEDADLDAVVTGAIEGAFFNQGEACTAGSRLLVHRSLHDEIVRRLARAIPRLVVGDGADAATHVGPMITREHQQKVLDYIENGQREGAVLAAQGTVPSLPSLSEGYFVAPTLFTGVTPGMRIAQEEVFGPVLTVTVFDTEDEALEIANGTEYGLIAGVYTADNARALRFSKRIKAGMVYVNNFYRQFIGTPFGGVGASGFGRVHSPETLGEFGRSKSIRLPSGISPVPHWGAVDDVLAEVD